MGWMKEVWRLVTVEEMSQQEAMDYLIAKRKQLENEHREYQEKVLGGSSEGETRA